MGLVAVVALAIAFGEVVMVITYLRYYAALVCVLLALFFLRIAWKAIANRHDYERNRQATILLGKYRRGRLTDDERHAFQHYCKSGVLTRNSHGVLRLSDQAVEDVFG